MDKFRFIFDLQKPDIENLKILFLEYAKELNVDLCFQDFENELKNLPGKYDKPDGCVILAYFEDKPAGCVALRKFKGDISEMKRLYVRPEFRKSGLGRILTDLVIKEAQKLNYKAIYLDTLRSLKSALKLYESFGFTETESYYPNPLEGVVYMELKI